MKNYLDLWGGALPVKDSIRLLTPVRVVGERKKNLGPRWEFAKVQLTVHPASGFEVEDAVADKDELERLGVGWPDAAIFGLLDVLMVAESGPLYKIRVVLEKAWYHDVDSSVSAFCQAGRDAGRKIIETIEQQSPPDPTFDMT